MNVRRQKDRRNALTFPEAAFTGELAGPTLKGRIEKRLPIIVVVRLVAEAAADTKGQEWTYTDNVSPFGARVFSKHRWLPGDEIWITPINEEPVLGEVVYCQHLQGDRYRFGVKFEGGPVTWRILQRFGRP